MRNLGVNILLIAALHGQQQSVPTFRAGTRLVEISVSVLDKKGNPVTGLSPEDVTVQDGGTTRPITFFRSDSPSMKTEGTRLPPGTYTNRTEENDADRPAVTALVLDALNTPQDQNAEARTQVMRYLRGLGPDSRIGLFLLGWDLRVLYDLTGNSDVLRARMEKVIFHTPPLNVTDSARSTAEAEELMKLFEGTDVAPVIEAAMHGVISADLEASKVVRRNQMDISLVSMEALGRRLAGIPGRKSVVWITPGIQMAGGTLNMSSERVKQTSQQLAQNGVTLYVVDPGGVKTPAQSSSELSSQPSIARGGGASGKRSNLDVFADTQDMTTDTRASMTLMTSITGGRYLYGTNDLTTGFKQALADIRGSYTLGFYAPEAGDNKWHRLKVAVKRSGVSLRHRQGYLAENIAAQPAEWDDAAWKAAFSNPVGSSVIPLTALCDRNADGDISVALKIDALSLSFRPEGDNVRSDLQLAFWDGKAASPIIGLKPSVPAAKLDELRAQGIQYRHQLKPSQQSQVVRAVVHDMRTGQYGTLDIPVKTIPVR